MSTGLHRRGYKRLRVRRGADEVFRHTILFATRASLRQRGVSFVGPMACETIDNNGYVLQLVGEPSADGSSSHKRPVRLHKQWALYCRKDAKNSGQWGFLSTCEDEHGRFRALFAGMFWPKMQNGRTSPKNKKLSSPVYRKGRSGRKGREGFTADGRG